MNNIYIYQVLSSIAVSLANIFLPVYMYVDLKFSLFQIALFWTINQAIFVMVTPFGGKVIEKLGVKHTISLYIPFMITFWYLLRFLKTDFYSQLGFIFLLLMIRAIPKSFFNTAEVVFISKNILGKKKKNYGSSLAKIRIVLIATTLLAPLFGGAITYFLGFEMLFNSAIILLLVSAIPLYMTKDQHFHIDLDVKKIWNFALHKLSKDFIKAEIGRCFANSAVWLLWPLFLYIIVANTLDLGIILSASGIISMVIAYYVGKKIDKMEPKRMLRNSTRIATGIFYFRTVFTSPILVAFSDIVNRVFEPVLMVPYEKHLYKYINSFKNILEISISKTLISEGAYGIGFLFIALMFLMFSSLGIAQNEFVVFFSIFFFCGTGLLFMSRILRSYGA